MSSVIAAKSASYVAGLDTLKEDDRLRGIMPRIGTDFSSSDYLALASARMKKSILTALEAGTPVGAGGSRLLRGNCEEHECLEAEAAPFFGAQTALFFGGGYFASLPVLTMLPQRRDLLVLESLVHASPHEGARAGRAAFRICAHKDPLAIESEIRDWRAAGGAGQVWIVVESLYSMHSDLAPLEDLLTIADRHDAFLVVGEVHASGVCSEQGRGLTAPYEGRENLLVVHRCGKALGAVGALVTASGVLRDFLIKCCCPFIFADRPFAVNGVGRTGGSVDPGEGGGAPTAPGEACRVHASGDGCARRGESFELADPALFRCRECPRHEASLRATRSRI
ncbi:8-amino-7-oxononanoate synthase [Bradyrhizobium sp. I1.7.5]